MNPQPDDDRLPAHIKKLLTEAKAREMQGAGQRPPEAKPELGFERIRIKLPEQPPVQLEVVPSAEEVKALDTLAHMARHELRLTEGALSSVREKLQAALAQPNLTPRELLQISEALQALHAKRVVLVAQREAALAKAEGRLTPVKK